MPTELTDEEAAIARRAVGIIQQLNSNPDARAHLERGLKVLDPKVQTTEDVQESLVAPLRAEMEAMRKQLSDERAAAAEQAKKDAEEAALGRMESSFARLRGQGLTAEGETKIKEIMAERQIFDPEAAFALFEKQNPKPVAEHSSWTPDRWNYEQEAVTDTKALFTNPEGWCDQEVGQILLEERRRSGDS